VNASALVSLALRLVVGGVFLVAGALKLEDPTAFAAEVANYHMASGLAPYLAVALPPVEVLVGVAVLALPEAWRRAGALCAAAMMLAFTVAVASAVARGINVSCGCFGSSSETVSWLTVARDVALLAASGALLVMRRV